MSAAPQIPEPIELVGDDDDTPAPAATVELRGRRFPVGDDGVPLLSMMKLATIAKRQMERGPDAPDDPLDEMESMAILYELLRSTIAPEAWPEFERHANAVRAGTDELQGLIGQAAEARAARPTRPSSGSPGGPSTTGQSSAGGSSSPASPVRQGDPRVQADLEARGRPDLSLVVKRAGEASTASSRR